MKRLIILLLITSIVFVITSEGFCKITNANPLALSLPASNTQPIAVNDSLTLCGNTSFILANVQQNDSDADGDQLTTSIISGPLNGTAVLVGNQIKYSPSSSFIGNDIIIYRISDNATPSLSDTAILSIDVHALPSVTLGFDKIICSGDSVEIGTQPVQGYSYSWFPAINMSASNVALPIVYPAATVNYILTVTNTSTGCAQNDTIRVTVNSLPVADAGAGDTICLGVTVILGTPPVAGNTYLWNVATGLDSVNAAQPNAIPIVETTYFLTVTDSITGCHQSDSVLLVLSPLVESNAGNLTRICAGGTAKLGAGPNPAYTYSWLPSEHLNSDTISDPDASPLETTFYQLTVTDTASGCQSIDLVQVKVYPLPVVLPGPDESICFGDSVMIGVVQDTANFYLWTPPTGLSSNTVQQPMAKPGETTIYTISVTNPGCIIKQVYTVFVIPLPVINAGIDTTLCTGIETQLGSAEITGNTYSWLPPEGLSSVTIPQPVASITETSTYYLTVVNDSTGCIAKDLVTITVNSTFTNSTLQNQTINAGESTIIGSSPDFGITYSWSPSTGLNSTVVSQPIANPLVTTTYSVTETDENGCVQRGTLTVNVLEEVICDSTIYNGFSPNGDGVDDFWNLPMLVCYPVNEVTIINRWSNEVWKMSNYDSQIVRWNGQNMNGQDLPDGIYYYKISYDDKLKTGWVMLKR